MQQLRGSQIKNLITKFYYKENHLCFQILIHCESDQTVRYREYSDYAQYKQEYDRLLKVKSENGMISIENDTSKSTQMSFA